MAENKDHSSIKKMAEGIDRLNDWLGRIAAFLIYPGMLILAYEVGARYLFNAPTIWAHGTSQRIFAVYFIVGAPANLSRRAFFVLLCRASSLRLRTGGKPALGDDLFLEDAYERQVAVELIIVQPVPDDEPIGQHKAGVGDVEVEKAFAGLVE